MTRTTDVELLTSCQYTSCDTSGCLTQLLDDPTYCTATHTRRDEITTTIPDSSGFRQPTPYKASGWSRVAFNGYLRGLVVFPSYGIQRSYEFRGNPTAAGNNFAPLPVDPPLASAADVSQNSVNRAVTSALLKAKEQKVNLAVAFAEFEKSAKLIADRALSLFRSYRALRQGNLQGAWAAIALHPGNASKKVATTVLEVQYGWRPLMQDVSGAYDLARDGLKLDGALIKVLSIVTDIDEDSDDSLLTLRRDNIGFNLNTYDLRTRIARVSLFYRVNNESLRAAANVGATNPLTIAWELTPYSFVLDWFLPIGNFLDALDATTGTSFVSGTLTRLSRNRRILRCYGGVTRESGISSSSSEGSVSMLQESFAMQRTVYLDSPMPLPYVKNPFSGQHVANATALIRGRYR